jgi:hypothetical protein
MDDSVMTLLSDDALRKIVDASCSRASNQAICDDVGIRLGTYFGWLARSKADEKNNVGADSPFWISIPPYGFCWLHAHVRRSKTIFKLGLEGVALDLCAGLATEICYGPQDGLPIQERNALYRHRSDQWMIENGLDPAIDRYEWIRDPLSDEILGPKYQRKEAKPSAQLVIAALRAMLPASWSEKVDHDHHVSGQVIHQLRPPEFVSRNTPQKQEAAVIDDADFSDVPALPPPVENERPDIAELRRKAAELIQNGPKNPKPTAPVNTGLPLDDGAPSTEYGGGPRAQEQQPQPSYARRTSVDAERTSPRGGNLNRSVR